MEFQMKPRQANKHMPGWTHTAAISVLYLVAFVVFHWVSKGIKITAGVPDSYPLTLIDFTFLTVAGTGYLPLVLVADLVRGFLVHDGQVSLLSILLAQSIHAVLCAIGAEVLRRRDRDAPTLRDMRSISVFLLVTLAIPIFSGLIHTIVWYQAEPLPLEDLLGRMQTIWAGYASLMLMITPIVIVLIIPMFTKLLRRNTSIPLALVQELETLFLHPALTRTLIQFSSLIIAIVVFYWLIASGEAPFYYLLVPPLMWISLSRGLLGTTLGNGILGLGSAAMFSVFGLSAVSMSHLPMGMLTISASILYFGAMVSSRQRAIQETSDQQEMYSQLSDAAFDGVLVCDGEMIIDVNRRTMDMLGYTREEISSIKADRILGTDPSRLLAADLKNRELVESTIFRKNGTCFNAELCSRRVLTRARDIRIIAFRDITRRKLTEQALRENESKYRMLFQNMHDGFAYLRVIPGPNRTPGDFIFQEVNSSFEDLTGFSREEIHGRKLADLAPKGMLEVSEILTAYGDMAMRGKPVRLDYFSDHAEKWFQVYAYSPQPGYMVTLFHDVTELKEAELSLRESQRKLSTLLGNLPGMAYRCKNDRFWTMEFVSQGCLEITGYQPSELVGNKLLSFNDLIHPDDREMVREAVDTGLASRTRSFRLNYRLFDAHGVLRWVWEQGTGVATVDGKISAIEGFITDITERKIAEEERRRLEEKIQHAHRLESLGVLTGGIAHDFNNLLVSILASADLALQNVSDEMVARTNLMRIETAAARASELTSQMLDYAGQGHMRLANLSLNDLVLENLPLVRKLTSSRAEIKTRMEEDLPLVTVDQAQMKQVLIKLMSNASDALPDGVGVITLTTGLVLADRSYLSQTYPHQELPVGQYVFLEISDTGCGMDEDMIERVFEPFFTTKFPGRGLGLAAVLGIARGHRGALKVESMPGRGTTFRLLLPKAVETQQEFIATRSSTEDFEIGTVLVVDDEESIREVTGEILDLNGFEVLFAVDGEEALQIFEENMDQLQLVILDLTMPKMDGATTLKKMKKLRREIPIILSSGYGSHSANGCIDNQDVAEFLPKPYSATALVDAVKRVLKNYSQT